MTNNNTNFEYKLKISYLYSIKFGNMKSNKQQILSTSILIAELTDEDVEKRLKSVASLKIIGTALGATRIRNQLIPHLKQQIAIDDDSRVIIAMLENIHSLGEIINDYCALFSLLEEVMNCEECQVRQKAVEVYEKVVTSAGIQKNQAKIISSLKNILSGQFPEGKEGAIRITARKLGQFSENNRQFLLSQYQSFAQSNIYCLRRFTSFYSKDLAQWLGDHQVAILKIVEILFKDKQQSNKIYLIDTIITLSKFKNQNFLQAYFNLISYQFTWRVRYELISKVDELGKVLGSPDKFRPFLAYMVKYINDIEPQIRSISCLKLQTVIEYVQPEDIVGKIIPALKNIPQDPNPYVKISLAKSLLYLCKKIGKKQTSQHILPKFLQLLKDEQIQVRLTLFNNISELCSVLGVETLTQTTIPAIVQLASNPNWRVRVSSIDFLFYLIKEADRDFVNDKIIKLVMDYVEDKANAVRKQGIKLLAKIQDAFGSQWFEQTFMQKIMEIGNSESYLQRQTFLNCISALLPRLTPQFTQKKIAPLIYSTFVKDPVQNVKITVCETLRVLYLSAPREKQQVKKALRILMNEKDKDVREIATQKNKQLS